MGKIKKLFTDHPNSRGETYFEHLLCAAGYGLRMMFAGFAAVIHSIFPFLFETIASDLAREITGDIESRNDESAEPEQAEIFEKVEI